jgi:alanine dehydrogenase
MIIGVPKEIKTAEKRVALTPAGASALIVHGHKVYIEKGAGEGSGMLDQQYQAAGAEILATKEEIWNRAEMIIKVKEPLEPEIELMREGQIIFTYLHLAAAKELTLALMKKKVVAIAYETIQIENGSLPLLVPMSEVAGCLSIQMGAYALEAKNGGSGVLLSGVSGVRPAKVAVIGGGVAGINACRLAVGMGARVSIFDINPQRLAYIQDVMQGHVTTLMSNRGNIEDEVCSSDLVIGAVLIPGAKAPKLVTRDMIKNMKKGSAIVDISVDQGGCFETTKPTTHNDPTYICENVVHYCVANMPGAVPRTSTFALTNVTLSYALDLANHGYKKALDLSPALRKGLNVYDGKITYKGVAEAFGLEYHCY